MICDAAIKMVRYNTHTHILYSTSYLLLRKVTKQQVHQRLCIYIVLYNRYFWKHATKYHSTVPPLYVLYVLTPWTVCVWLNSPLWTLLTIS